MDLLYIEDGKKVEKKRAIRVQEEGLINKE